MCRMTNSSGSGWTGSFIPMPSNPNELTQEHALMVIDVVAFSKVMSKLQPELSIADCNNGQCNNVVKSQYELEAS